MRIFLMILIFGVITACSGGGGGGQSQPSAPPPPPDTSAPTPSPMQWASVPQAATNTSVIMTAATATDATGVEYYFEETSGNPGGDDSGWQVSPSYTDIGLSPDTAYTYRVRARDRSPAQNLTDWSTAETATTFDMPVGIDQEGPIMALEGQFNFTASGTGGEINWSVDRFTRSVVNGVESTETAVFSAIGPDVSFNLTKVMDAETIYQINAADAGFTEMITVQVFPENEMAIFTYQSDGNPDVRVYVFVPASLTPDTKLISLHHGTNRNADLTIENWTGWGEQNDFIAISPEFDRANWPGSRSYNLGNMFTGNDGAGSLNPEARWSFTIARDIALKVLDEFDLNDDEYDIWGHSAGGQFSHRMMIFRSDAPIRWALPANPGWWTEPSLAVDYPYGLRHPMLSYTQQDILDWTNRPMIIFRGENDTGTTDLRVTPEANAQGATRFERAQYMFDRGLDANPNNSWELRTVDNCGHSSSCMAPQAQSFLDAQQP